MELPYDNVWFPPTPKFMLIIKKGKAVPLHAMEALGGR
jgi:hypothetical protein